MTSNYEVRLLLDPDAVLSFKLELADTVLSTFHVASTTKMNVQFLDTCSKDIYTAGWSTRIRKAENDDLELTYKKRYATLPVHSGRWAIWVFECPSLTPTARGHAHYAYRYIKLS
ncbi:hypothetical protein PEX1_080960 [Penicillium expansum]|uniref:Uncharacterized protein n=1 Tax=Penicillium expansum TaxID=27334 RepID=A0A0A2KSK5_PENEN|nr:hypothetical protein PEX2_002950 [Penicillium expansum]KGO42820.1 hypothetical protein PEXP_025690 [Penicillium expansum]KGO56941.1 hypothetical protein PEX2_002950 [Penicillium expansum]KGO69933.1 hypothetical protein PEX1_080960 [Penicillium expansum]